MLKQIIDWRVVSIILLINAGQAGRVIDKWVPALHNETNKSDRIPSIFFLCVYVQLWEPFRFISLIIPSGTIYISQSCSQRDFALSVLVHFLS